MVFFTSCVALIVKSHFICVTLYFDDYQNYFLFVWIAGTEKGMQEYSFIVYRWVYRMISNSLSSVWDSSDTYDCGT